MGILIGLAILACVLYAIAVTSTNKSRQQHNIKHLLQARIQVEQHNQLLQQQLTTAHDQLQQQQHNLQQQLQAAYRQGFQDGLAQQQQ